MAGRPPSGTGEWLPYAGLALTIAALIWQGGVISNTVSSNTNRIVQLETKDNARSADLQAISIRTARMEATLAIIAASTSRTSDREDREDKRENDR